MSFRPFVFVLAAFAGAGSQAETASQVTTGSRLPPTNPVSSQPVGPEEVVVAAPEPRYVAPTLRDRIGRVWAPVYINGVGPFRLVLDTGANRSVVVRSVAHRLGAPIRHDNKARLHGVTGSSVVPTIHVDSVEVGDLWLDQQRLPIVEDVFGGAEGVLGADGLADKRVFIDFRNDEISIRYSKGRGTLPFGYTRVPVKMREGHLLMFDVFLAGVRTKALLDTGAQSTIGNNSLREALARRAKQGVPDSIVGVTLDVQEGQTFRAPPVTIADITIKGMRVTFGDVYIFEAWNMNDKPAILIGMDIIGLLDSMIIDYKNKELQLRARR